MTTNFRLESISLDTVEGMVTHSFPGPLTVLAGSVGVGKSTLFELVKYGLGGDGLLADVVITSITSVTLDVAIGSERYSITRSISSPGTRTVKLRDLTEQTALPEHYVNQDEPSLNSLLLAAMDLPDDMRAATTKLGSTNPGARITFYDVFKYMYVSQGSINEQIAGSGDNYYQPKRRAVFELLFGLTNPYILDMQSEIATIQSEYEVAKRDFEIVSQFLSDSQTESRLETERSQFEATKEKYRAEQSLTDIENMLSPVVDDETRTLRDLLLEAEQSAAEAQNALTLLIQQKQDFVRERSLLQQDIARLKKMINAGERIAKIEFAVCPRCMQDVRKRTIPEHACRLCLQEDPVALSDETVDSGSNYELVHLVEQVA